MSWVIARYYGAEQAGLFFLALAVVTFLGTIARAGVDISIVRFIGAAEGNKHGTRIGSVINKALSLTIPLTVIASSVIIAAGDVVATHVFEKPSLGPFISVTGLALPGITLLTVYGMGLQGLHKTVSSVITLKIAGPLLFIAMIFPLFEVEGKYLPTLYAAAMFTAGLVGAGLFRALRPVNDDGDAISWRQFTNSTRPLWMGQIAQQIMLLSSQIICGVWLSSQDVALLTTAQRTAMLTPFILLAVNMVVAPKFSALHEAKKFDQLENLAVDATKIMLMVGGPVAVLIMAFSSQIMSAFGSDFAAAGVLLQIITLGQLVNVATGSANMLLVSSGNEEALKSTYYTGAAVALVACVVLIPTYGVIGGAIATAIALAVQNLATVVMVRKRLRMRVLPTLKF
jgi:O-antigen/teichoic acid export membrane protein